MKKSVFFVSVLILAGCNFIKTTHTKKLESVCREDANTLASITKILLSRQEISDLLFSYTGETDTVYVAIKMEPYISQIRSYGDKYILHKDKIIAFYDYRELFFFGIKTWLEYNTIMTDKNRLIAEFHIVVKLPNVKTDNRVYKAVFECINEEIRLRSLTLL